MEISRVGIGEISSPAQGLVGFQAQGFVGFGGVSNPEVGFDLLPYNVDLTVKADLTCLQPHDHVPATFARHTKFTDQVTVVRNHPETVLPLPWLSTILSTEFITSRYKNQ